MTVTHVRGRIRAEDHGVHRWEAPSVHVAAFSEAIPTWTARTPAGTSIEVRIRVGRSSGTGRAGGVAAPGSSGAAPTGEKESDTPATGQKNSETLPAGQEGSGISSSGPAVDDGATPSADAGRGTGGASAAGWSDRAVVARWSTDPEFRSTTVPGQAVHGITVEADTVRVDASALGGAADVFEVEALLHPGPSGELPVLERISVLTRGPAPRRADIVPSAPGGIDIELLLPPISQRRQGELPGYGGGDVWCSPTSLTMLLDFLDHRGGRADPVVPGTPATVDAPSRGADGTGCAGTSGTARSGDRGCPGDDAASSVAGRVEDDGPLTEGASPAVRTALRGVWDAAYDGAGNWAFNTAWAAALGFDAFLDTLPDLRAGEELLAAGEPFIASVMFDAEELPEAGYETGGHLLVVSGLTADGDVRVHDPAARTPEDVRRIYPRAAFERAWLSHEGSGGLIYRVRWPR
ncbi:C39 family peptidase [Brevibacterium ihuae]|uniref:C39 family peptidase n=1 Tax=Brevibacterium ihuae TaxID=1631743 RepID=UPI000C75A226|nr:C39 family peptidase [Brevibacterium ihuae]